MLNVAAAIVYYSICSSSLLVINKLTVNYFPAPCVILFLQLLFSAAVVLVGFVVGLIQHDALDYRKLKHFGPICVGFLGTIFANLKVLQHSNVETFITFRSCSPLIIAFCEYLFLGRQLPSPANVLCLGTLVIGASGYVYFDSAFKIEAYVWLGIWFVAFVFEAVYVKHVCQSVQMSSWERVFYTNMPSALALAAVLPWLPESKMVGNLTRGQTVLVSISCIIGLMMSHAGYILRDAVSATMFTVVGIVCKILTVLWNMLIWENHASDAGLVCLATCIVAGAVYRQSPMRTEVQVAEPGDAGDGLLTGRAEGREEGQCRPPTRDASVAIDAQNNYGAHRA